ncbi:hypothetical protein [Actinoplanes sp. NPDC026670]|uniref:hypothetical protein n=1 Tax=Actinoplanes sp. NPDC026670 TaxID=3154700 RepID=UPI0033CBF21A
MYPTKALQLIPRTVPEHQPCPAWCLGHFDGRDGGRTHQSLRRSVMGRATATGTPAEVRMWSELHDDGAGSVTDVWVLEVAGVRVEMTCARMYDLLKTTEAAFWRLDTSGYTYLPRERA